MKCRIHRIDSVDRSELRRQDVRHLVAVIALKTNPGAIQAEMAMRLNKSRIHVFSGSVDDFAPLRNNQILTDGRDLSPIRQNIGNIRLFMHRVVN